VWQCSELFADLRSPQTGGACTKCAHFDACRGGCMAAKFFTGLPLDGPDPECVQGYGETALATRDQRSAPPKSSLDHSHTGPVRGRPTLLGMPAVAPGEDLRRKPAGRPRPALRHGMSRRCGPSMSGNSLPVTSGLFTAPCGDVHLVGILLSDGTAWSGNGETMRRATTLQA